MDFSKKYKIFVGVLLVILAGSVGIEVLTRSFIRFSPLADPLTSLKRVGAYHAPDIAVGFYPENFINDFVAQDGKLYISDFGSHLRVIDASNPKNLKEIAVLSLEYQAGIATLTPNYLFLTKFPHLEPAEIPEGKAEKIEIFTVSGLEKVGEYTPQCTKLCFTSDSAIVLDDILYLPIIETERFNGIATKSSIHILDIADPKAVSKQAEIQIPVGGFSFDGNQEYLGITQGDRFHIFSRENTGSHELASTYVLPQNERYACQGFNDIAIQGNTAYLLGQYGETAWCGHVALRIFDISNPVSPKELGIFEFPYNAGKIEVKDNYVFVGNRARGMRVLDVSNPAAPKEAAHYTRFLTPLYQEIWQMKVDREYAYVAGHQVLGSLKRIDIVDISSL